MTPTRGLWLETPPVPWLSLGPSRLIRLPSVFTPVPEPPLAWGAAEAAGGGEGGGAHLFWDCRAALRAWTPWTGRHEASGLAQCGCLYWEQKLSTKQRTNEGGSQEWGPKVLAIPKSWCIDNQTVLNSIGHRRTMSRGLTRLEQHREAFYKQLPGQSPDHTCCVLHWQQGGVQSKTPLKTHRTFPLSFVGQENPSEEIQSQD